jgi:hypothetical protein
MDEKFLRSEEGLRRGGHTRGVNETQWGKVDPATAKNATGRGDPAYTQIGSHDRAPPKAAEPGQSEGNPRGFKGAGAPTPRVAAQPAGMIGRRK